MGKQSGFYPDKEEIMSKQIIHGHTQKVKYKTKTCIN